jgi:hypothetical protein
MIMKKHITNFIKEITKDAEIIRDAIVEMKGGPGSGQRGHHTDRDKVDAGKLAFCSDTDMNSDDVSSTLDAVDSHINDAKDLLKNGNLSDADKESLKAAQEEAVSALNQFEDHLAKYKPGNSSAAEESYQKLDDALTNIYDEVNKHKS